jgi:hypothetical protein
LQWSKTRYTYGTVVFLLQLGGDNHAKGAAALIDKVPHLRQRVAGKSISLEVSHAPLSSFVFILSPFVFRPAPVTPDPLVPAQHSPRLHRLRSRSFVSRSTTARH